MTPEVALSGYDVSRETIERLSHYVALIEKWNPAINLVAKSTLPSIWHRHIADSLQVASYLQPEQRKWVDLGSGGGLPGLVVAIVAMESCPELQLELVEVDQRKSVFLRQVIRELGLNAQVHTAKIETLSPQGADVLSARALAPLTALCAFAQRHSKPGGVCLFSKGAQAEEEILEAKKHWSFRLEQATSKTEPLARLLILREIAHV